MKSKYIFTLFLSMYISACISPLAAVHLQALPTKAVYAGLAVLLYLPLLGCDRLFTAISRLSGCETWLDIYERPLRGNERIYGLDVVRFFAIVSVPAIHFMGLTGYYEQELSGGAMFLATCIRWLFICCVPLFMTLTGYFKHKKSFDLAHYKSIFEVLATHVFITCVRLFVDYKYHGIELTREYIVDKLVFFEYGWYVRLYIGIMLLAPFFNLIWSSLEERVHKELLILTLIFLCSMGPLTFGIIPASWVILYVFLFYFLGAYLCEYEVYINKWLNLLLIAAMTGITALGQFLSPTAEGTFDWSFAAYSGNSGYSSLPAVILSFLIITLLIDADTHFTIFRGFFQSFSVVSLEMYMFSQMFDGILYPKLEFSSFTDIFPKMPLIVGGIVLVSYVVSHIKRLVFAIIKLPLWILHKD